VLAFATLAVAVLFVVVEGLRRWEVLVVGLASLSVLVVAGWYAVSRRGTVRLVALVVAVAAVAVFVVVMLATNSLRLLVVGLVLAAASGACARVALRPPAAPSGGSAVGSAAARPAHAVLLMNPRSGGGKAEKFELERRCRERGIEPVVLTPGSDLLALAEDAVRRGADVLGMAGGDGSQALVASVASRHDLPMVVVPAGTRNHFALDLGLDRADVVGALDAFDDGVEHRIDLADVNGRVFVNNASMGLYAKVVQSADYRDAKIRTAAAELPELLGPTATPLDLRFALPSGEARSSADLVLVSNNAYQLSQLRGAALRPRLDGGELGIVSVLVRSASEAERFAALEMAGQVRRFSGWDEWTAARFEVDSGGPVEVGVDGEALTLTPPLRFTIHPGALRIRLPRVEASRRRAAPRVHVTSGATLTALWQTALGRPVEAA
jgi:diacylglycerol kinase family enzyme